MIFIITILWFAIAGVTIFQYRESLLAVRGLKRAVALITLILGSPAVALGSLVSDILDGLLPEGWDSDDGDIKGSP